jgi:CBS domain-containing protein
MRKRLVMIADGAPLIDAAKCLLDPDIGLVVVRRSDGALAGVITKTDVIRQIGHCQGSACATEAAAVMTAPVTLCHPGDWLHDVWSIMKTRGLKNIPVVDQDSRPIGVLNVGDALEILLKEAENNEALLRDYVMCVGYR